MFGFVVGQSVWGCCWHMTMKRQMLMKSVCRLKESTNTFRLLDNLEKYPKLLGIFTHTSPVRLTRHTASSPIPFQAGDLPKQAAVAAATVTKGSMDLCPCSTRRYHRCRHRHLFQWTGDPCSSRRSRRCRRLHHYLHSSFGGVVSL